MAPNKEGLFPLSETNGRIKKRILLSILCGVKLAYKSGVSFVTDGFERLKSVGNTIYRCGVITNGLRASFNPPESNRSQRCEKEHDNGFLGFKWRPRG